MQRQHQKQSASDLVNRNKQLYERGLEVDIQYRNNDISLKEIITELRDNLAILIENNAEGYEGYTKKSIFNIIISTFQKKGMSSSTIKRVYEFFSNPDFDEFRYNVNRKDSEFYNDIGKQYAQSLIEGEKSIEDIKINDAILVFEQNKEAPRVQDYLRKEGAEAEKYEIKQRREKLESEKIKIPLPDWIDQSLGGAPSLTLDSLLYFKSTISECAKRVFRYPPAKDEDDRYYAEGITTLAKLFEPGTDLKFSRDVLSYFDIAYEMDSQSIHSAKSKSKIVTASGRIRGMTREQVPIIREKFWELAIDVTQKIPGFFHFCEYLRKYQKPYTADGILDRHDKLSESAFGNGTLVKSSS